MRQKLNLAVEEITKHREDIIAKLLEFAKTDLLFFCFTRTWRSLRVSSFRVCPITFEFRTSSSLYTKSAHIRSRYVPENSQLNGPLAQTLEAMSDKELACYYAAALNMRSTLLALALVKGRIHAEEACELSYLEELWQNKLWGKDEEAVSRRQERCEELKEIENYLRS